MKNTEIIKLINQRLDTLSLEHNNMISRLVKINNTKQQLENSINFSSGANDELRALKAALEQQDKDEKLKDTNEETKA